MTDAERRLWSRLRDRQLGGYKFRRQAPIGDYIDDFLCEEKRLVVEVDGGQHADLGKDQARTAVLESLGYRVVRYWNNEVLATTDGVLEHLLGELAGEV